MPGTKKKRTPLSPEELARRKQASETDRHLHGEPDPKGFSQVGGKAGKFTAKKATNFRHQGR